MTEPLSPNTKAILLLTAPLLASRGKRSSDLLTASEYRKLARHLRARGNQPADLMASAADRLLDDCGRIVERARLERLLGRGFLLGQALEHWQARAIWVVSRADEAYPKRLKERLEDASPPLLYGCGHSEILDHGGLAVVGSRHVHEALIELTEAVGRLAAAAGQTVVSGGARGIDQAAMRGALEAGGRVAGVLADGLERAVMRREHRNLLLEGRLVLTSPYDPSASFNVGHAMQRNKLIYALADAGLVVSAEEGRGGTWAGRAAGEAPAGARLRRRAKKGLDALRRKGALPWPSPVDAPGLRAALAPPTKANTDRSVGASLHDPVQVQLFRASGSGEEER